MHDNIVILGIFLSLIFSELTGIVPGGIVVPGYIALNLNNPFKIIYSLVIIILTVYIVKFISNFSIIYGKRRFTLMIMISFLLNYIIMKLNFIPDNPGIIGNIIPGIIANQIEKQGFIVTILPLSIVVILLALVLILFSIPIF